jgi:dolichyl-phosphate-mannose-protein mannosyltransferase
MIEKYAFQPYSKKWHKWLFFTGISLGCVISVKWVGIFTYATVGLFTIRQLWNDLSIVKRNPIAYIHHWFFRAVYLILNPLSVYMIMFYAHFTILERSGSGDSHMSSLFQSRLINSPIKSGLELVILGKSMVTIRNQGHGGGLLHSHQHAYPVGSKQTQITLYHYRDGNNEWKIMPIREAPDTNMDILLQDNSVIRLFHNSTKRNLHSHTIPAAINVYENEVSGYGNYTFGDDNDYWMVEIVSNKEKTDSFVHRLTTTFRLKHMLLDCYLSSTGERLPEWGFEQMEVVCSRDGKNRRSFWNIEENKFELVDSADVQNPLNSIDFIDAKLNPYTLFDFFRDFWDLNVAMWYGNNALTPKLGKKDILTSKPSQWPFLDVGLRMCNWNDDTRKFYLIGNPMVWWTCSISLVGLLICIFAVSVKEKMTGFISFKDEQFVSNGIIWLSSWLLHYVPFYIMGRVTYIHHYFPALLISVIAFAYLVQRFEIRDTIANCTALIISGTFIFFSPLSYGFTGSAENMSSRQWRNSWNIL